MSLLSCDYKKKRTKIEETATNREMGIVPEGESAIVDGQRSTWEALKKRINGLVKRATASNVRDVAEELSLEDLIWGRGLFCSAILESSVASPPDLQPVFAALAAAINSRFPDVGYLLLKRILNQFKIGLERKETPRLLPLAKLFAHLSNHGVVHELAALQLVFALLQDPTKDNVEVALVFIQQCYSAVHAYTPGGLDSVFERLHEILGKGDFEAHTACSIEDSSAFRRSRFSGYEAVPPELDIVELDDQVTHEISIFNEMDPEMFLDLFRLG